MRQASIESLFTRTARHSTHYLAAGPIDGPLMIFVHGWPELSLSWRHQLPVFAGLGFRVIAPDMRGYGQSSNYDKHEAFAQSEVVADMIELLDSLGREQAIWIGHDWGCATVWSLARLHPKLCVAVANLCVPGFALEEGLESVRKLVDRKLYPEAEYPYGQWEYVKFYEERFERATSVFDANPYNTAKLLFRKGNPDGAGQPASTAMVRRNGGWFGPLDAAPDVPRDGDVISEAELETYAESLRRNSFFGPDSYYMNHHANAIFLAAAANQITMPVLFLHARYDYVCETMVSRLAEPMRAGCTDLVERVIDSGHWMAQEQPLAVNAALVGWLVGRVEWIWSELPGTR